MAYKFQLGQAILSGALQQEGNVVVENEAGSTVGHILQSGIVSGSGQLQGASVAVDGAVSGDSLSLAAAAISSAGAVSGVTTLDASGLASLDGGIDVNGNMTVSAAGAVAGATSIDGSGDLTMGTITMTNFSVGAAGALSAASVVSRATVSGSGQLQGASVGVDGAVTAGTSFIIGSADLNEADMEKLDGITNGTAAASKVVVLDADRNITNINQLTASYFKGDGSGITNINVENLDAVGSDTQVQFNQNGEFGANANFTYDGSGSLSVSSNYSVNTGGTMTIGGTSIDEDAFTQIAGITAGTAAASKAVVLDASLDVSGFRNVSGSGNGKFRSVYAADLTQGRLVTAGASGLLEDQAALYYDDSREDGFLQLWVSSSASGSAALGDGMIELYNADDEVLFVASDYDATIGESGLHIGDQAAPADVLASGDVMVFLDGTDDDRLKKESIDDIATLFAGDGLSASSAVLAVDLNELTAAVVDVSADSIAIVDANDGNASRKESISDFAGALVNGTTNGLTSASGVLELSLQHLGAGTVDVANDMFAMKDATDDSTKIISMVSYASGIAGTGIKAASGSLALDLNELSALGGADVVATDQLAFVDAGDNSTKKVTMTNFLTSIAGAGVSVSNGQLITEGGAVQEVKTDNLTLQEGYNYMTGSAALTLTLPEDPSAGDVVHVKAGNLSGVAVTITGSGAQVMDGESSILLESPYAAVSLVYMTTNRWNLV